MGRGARSGKYPKKGHDFRQKPYGTRVETSRKTRQQQQQQQHHNETDTRWIDPLRGSDSERLDLAAILVKIIVNLRGQTTLHCLENELFKERKWKFADTNHGLRQFIDDFRHVFELYQHGDLGKDTITCKNLSLDLCPTHIRKAGSCRENCGALHICKFHLLSTCEIESCKFGHELQSDPHNVMVLKSRLVSELDFWEIKKIFRNLSNRHGPTIPSVCTYYNARGCKTNPCPFLHICQHYIDGDCKFGAQCKRSHDIFDYQPQQLLQKYGLQNESEYRLLRFIKEAKTATNFQTIESKYGSSSRGYVAIGTNVQCKGKYDMTSKMFVNGPKLKDLTNNVLYTKQSSDVASGSRYTSNHSNSKSGGWVIDNISNGDNDKLATHVLKKESSGEPSTCNNLGMRSSFEDNVAEKPFFILKLPRNGKEGDSTVVQAIQTDEDEKMQRQSNLDKTEDKSEISNTEENQSQNTSIISSWIFTEEGKTIEKVLSESERKKMERKYQEYLVAKEYDLTIEDTVYKIDFSTMKGIPYGPENKSGIQFIRR